MELFHGFKNIDDLARHRNAETLNTTGFVKAFPPMSLKFSHRDITETFEKCRWGGKVIQNKVWKVMMGIFLPLILLAQTENWVYRYNGPGNGFDVAGSLVYGADGNIYAAGYSYGSGTDIDVNKLCKNNKANILCENEDDIFKPSTNPSPRSLRTCLQLTDSLLGTIWLPNIEGGVVFPSQLIYNPHNEEMIILAWWNIAVCDVQTGEFVSVLHTIRTRKEYAYNEINNKLYCANCFERTIDVIDCQTYQTVNTIPLTDTATAAIWNSFSNEIYCTQHPPIQSECRIEVIDCVGDSLIASIPTGGYPKNLFQNRISNKIYCANYGVLDIIDGSNHSVIQQVSLDPANYYFFAQNTVNNKIYCTNYDNDNVTIVDGASDTLITTVALGSMPINAEYNPVTNRIYFGHLFSKNIYVLDGNTDEVIDILYFGATVCAMAYDSIDNRLFVISSPSDDENNYADMIVLDGTSHVIIDTIEVGVLPWNSMIWNGQHNQIWVGNQGYQQLPGYTIDCYSANSLARLFRTPVGFTPYAAVLNPITDKYYAVGRSDNYILIFDINNPDSCVLKETGECVWDIVLNQLENKIYCANNTGRDVSVIDGATDSLITQVPINADVHLLAMNLTDNKLYASSSLYPQSGYITVIDGHTNTIDTTIPVAWHPVSMLWNATDNKLYVSGFQQMVITILDAHADTILKTIPFTSCPWSLVHNSVDDKIYCSVGGDVVIIDGVSNEILKTISFGYRIFTFVYNPTNNKIYCGGGGRIHVIDGATDSLTNIVSISKSPYSLLYNPITNTIFCACLDASELPPRDAVVVMEGTSDEILADFTIQESQNFFYGTGGGISSPRKALLLDSLNNIVYFNHYSSSKISLIDGATGISERSVTSLRSTFLHVFPNPTARYVNVEFLLPGIYDVQMMIYDVTGRMVECFNFPNKKSHQFIWDGIDRLGKKVPSGVYFITLKAGDHREIVKLLFLK